MKQHIKTVKEFNTWRRGGEMTCDEGYPKQLGELLSQLSRKTETSRRPKMSDLRDSGSVEQDADVILFIHTEQVDNPETEWKNYSDLYVGKNRQGALGRIPLRYIGHQVRFEHFSGTAPEWDAPQSKRRGME